MSTLEATKLATLKTVLKGLFYRYEQLAKVGHPGWDVDAWRHRTSLGNVRGRIMDVIATTFGEDNLPDVVLVTHDHTVYRVDYIQGALNAIATMPSHLPCDIEIAQVIEVGA